MIRNEHHTTFYLNTLFTQSPPSHEEMIEGLQQAQNVVRCCPPIFEQVLLQVEQLQQVAQSEKELFQNPRG